ncbi:MAG: phytoene/squalene synthase family protein [Alphaproteobacteria bacterium]
MPEDPSRAGSSSDAVRSPRGGAGSLAQTLARLPAATASAADLAFCDEVIRRNSRSFHVASRLLPRAIRERAIATYAFCRGADDDVDRDDGDPRARHLATRQRLARLYAGEPMDDPVGRAFAAVVAAAGIPREEPEALLDGMAQDLGVVRMASEDDLVVYAWRAAGVVGCMMSRIMGRGDDQALRRAIDLGIGMQLTNVARDVGEDAARDRVYLPADWLAEAGSSVGEVLARRPTPGVLATNRRVLALAERYYESGIGGIRLLPPRCRPAILTAALTYREIGRRVLARGGDGVSSRVAVPDARKLALVASACARCVLDPGLRGEATEPHRPELHAALGRAGVRVGPGATAAEPSRP